jgi:hypothetical protein
MDATGDRAVRCSDCFLTFILECGEIEWMRARGWCLPKRCKPCRQARKAQREVVETTGAPRPHMRGIEYR